MNIKMCDEMKMSDARFFNLAPLIFVVVYQPRPEGSVKSLNI